MAKFIIYINGRPIVQGYKIFEFLWDEALQIYVYQGKQITEDEFDDVVLKVFGSQHYRRLFPFIKCIEKSSVAPVVVAPPVEPPAPISTITTSREITLDEAEAVIQRLAPNLLKKKPGQKQMAATG